MAGFIVYMLLPCKKLNSSLLPETGLLPAVWLLLVLLSPGPKKKKKRKGISDDYYYVNVVEWSARQRDVTTTLEMKHLICCGVLWHLSIMDYPKTRYSDQLVRNSLKPSRSGSHALQQQVVPKGWEVWCGKQQQISCSQQAFEKRQDQALPQVAVRHTGLLNSTHRSRVKQFLWKGVLILARERGRCSNALNLFNSCVHHNYLLIPEV